MFCIFSTVSVRVNFFGNFSRYKFKQQNIAMNGISCQVVFFSSYFFTHGFFLLQWQGLTKSCMPGLGKKDPDLDPSRENRLKGKRPKKVSKRR